MKEIGGYIELDRYSNSMLYENALHLNCGRNALAYLIESKNIRRIKIPKFLCNSVKEVCEKYGLIISYYSIGIDFLPQHIKLEEDEWIYIVNYYGQLSDDMIKNLKSLYKRTIFDYVHAYFQYPIPDTQTLYSCRKFFGVSDGAILFTDTIIGRYIEVDESFERMTFLLGRFERNASDFYSLYVKNNELFSREPIKKMSCLTYNLLHALDYDHICKKRTRNFQILHNSLSKTNTLELSIPDGPYMYPYYIENGNYVRKKLLERNIYIPTLWPDVFTICDEEELEYHMATDILPLPVDQRYDDSDMNYIIQVIKNLTNKK